MVTRKDAWERHVSQVALVERFDSVLFPVDLATLLNRLPELGWVVPKLVEEEGKLRVGESPSKGNVRLRFDQQTKTIGVASTDDLVNTIAGFTEITNLAKEVSDLDGSVPTDYVEFRYLGWLKGASDPLQVFQSWWSGSKSLEKLGASLGDYLPSDSAAMAPYGIRLASSGKEANRPNWAELSISPLIVAPHKRYQFDLLFRNRDSAVTLRVAEAANEVLSATMAQLEKSR